MDKDHFGVKGYASFKGKDKTRNKLFVEGLSLKKLYNSHSTPSLPPIARLEDLAFMNPQGSTSRLLSESKLRSNLNVSQRGQKS